MLASKASVTVPKRRGWWKWGEPLHSAKGAKALLDRLVPGGSSCSLGQRCEYCPSRWDESSSCHSAFMTEEVECGTGIGRVLHFHSDASLPHGSQHLSLQPLSPVSSAHHDNLYSGLQHPEEREAFFGDVLVGSYVPLHHGVREQRAGPEDAISVDREAAAVVAVDVHGVRGLALQQRDARPLIQLVIRRCEPMPTPWGPQQLGGRTAQCRLRSVQTVKHECGSPCLSRSHPKLIWFQPVEISFGFINSVLGHSRVVVELYCLKKMPHKTPRLLPWHWAWPLRLPVWAASWDSCLLALPNTWAAN